jgi:PAS domain S-box-containing protein
MGKIALIAPSEEIFTTGSRIAAELGLQKITDCYIGWMNQGVAFARQAEAGGADVIISRGGTAELISKSGIQAPLIEIPITFQDLAEILIKAREIADEQNPRIAVLAFRNMIRNIEVFARVMALDLKIYRLDSEEDIAAVTGRALKENNDVVIGGIQTTVMSKAYGAKALLLTSGEESYRDALLQAERVLYARTLEKERSKMFRVLVDYSIQGIIGIDSEKKISVFNNAAERLIGINAGQALSKNIHSVFPSMRLDTLSEGSKVKLGELVQVNEKKLIANIIPIDVGESVSGAMITLEDIGQIVEMEAAIRQEIYSKGLYAQYHFEDILGSSAALAETKRIAEEYAGIDATVIITGASGTGKELYAQSIHNASKRRQRPFVAVNCGAIPSSLLESELFGYAEGAFTGANKKGKPGLFELAHGGTIFLDEIGEMDKLAQTSLLRVIQERRVMRLGGEKYLPIDVRIIAASNNNLARLVQEGRLREDLYYRINVLPLELPALKDRPGDALFIARHFLKVYNEMFDRKQVLSGHAKAFIESYEWPGNVRELRNYVERLVVTQKESVITVGIAEKTAISVPEKTNDKQSEKAQILLALAETGYNQQEAAKRLGINRSTLYRKMKSLHIELKKSAFDE